MSGRIDIQRDHDRHIGEIVINNPAKRNAISSQMAKDFCDALSTLEHDNSVKVIVISGAGRDLTSGTDANEIVERFRQPEGQTRPRPLNQRSRFEAAALWWGPDGVFRRVLHCPKVTVVAARGYCFEAGLYLTLYSDLTVASDTALFGNPHWRHIGVNGDVSMLIAAVGLKRAKDLIYCGAEWNASEAMSFGLIDQIAPCASHDAAIAHLAGACSMIMRDAVNAEKQVVFASLARMQIETGMYAATVVSGWGTNIHFRDGEFNFLQAAKRSGVRAAIRAGRDHFQT